MFAQRSLGEDVNQSQAFEQLQIYSKARPYLNICKAVTNKTVMICHLCWAVRGARQCDVSGLGSLHWLSAMPGFAMRHGFLPMTKDFGFPYRPNGLGAVFLTIGIQHVRFGFCGDRAWVRRIYGHTLYTSIFHCPCKSTFNLSITRIRFCIFLILGIKNVMFKKAMFLACARK